MNFMKYLFLALCISAVSAAATVPDCAGIEAGTKAYNESDFERAIDEWRTCVDNGIEDADLYYNLGNAYFRNGKLGFSIFYYKKALRLRANDDDIQHNLKFAQAMTRDKVEDEEENPILSGLFKAHHALSLKAQLFTLLAIFWLIAFIGIAGRIVIGERAKNICTGAIFVLTAIFCVIGSSAAYKIFVLEKEICGVVTATDADVTSAPSDKSQTLNTLSEGTTFEVISEQGNFAEIRLGEKIKGFVKLSEVGIIK
ncbi:tetratricopeptide repeat protein [uncultured Fibrobacter sp.]|uniref:tetratricopeptide repeat protein n=1 Tax=uncultured Fibrobacter sp. TaxID=261512 RepID=UPI0025FA4E7E|nr:tetratricopeptide repeat protein [uncultured Fibrobacter sp.]